MWAKTASRSTMTNSARSLLLASVALLLEVTTACAQSYSFSTIAGVPGTPGTNDGVNQAAQFSFPVGVTLDRTGNIFVADFLNHTVRQITPSGTNWITSTIAGSPGVAGTNDGPGTVARFNRPTGIALDSVGNIFVSERYNHTIREISPQGTNWVVTTVAGSAGVTGSEDGTNTDARFYLPSGLAIDSSNHIYVADAANFTIREIDPVGTNWVVSTIAGSVLNAGFVDGTNTDALFNYPYGLALAPSGKLYVADWGNYDIREMTHTNTDWVVQTIAGFSHTNGATDGPASAAKFNNPAGIAVAADGNLYVTDQSNSTIRKLAPGSSGWVVSTVGGQVMKTGSADGISTNALFKKPWGIAADSAGNLFIADYSNSAIRKGLASNSSPPVLELSLFESQMVLSWPSWASNYVAETTANMAAGAVWMPLTNGVTAEGARLVLTNSLNGSQSFYRLKKQNGAAFPL